MGARIFLSCNLRSIFQTDEVKKVYFKKQKKRSLAVWKRRAKLGENPPHEKPSRALSTHRMSYKGKL